MNTLDKDCIFCKIIRGEIPSFKVYEDDDVFCFMDIKPVQRGHILVVPKYHTDITPYLPKDKMMTMFSVAQEMGKLVREKLGCSAVNFFLNDGKHAGQEVPHVHLHVVPRNENDGFGYKFPEGYNTPPSIDEIKKDYEKLVG